MFKRLSLCALATALLSLTACGGSSSQSADTMPDGTDSNATPAAEITPVPEGEVATDMTAAHHVLSQYVVTVRVLVQGGSFDMVNPALLETLQLTKRLRADEKLDESFHDRTVRLINVTLAAMVPMAKGTDNQAASAELKAFVKDVGGAPLSDPFGFDELGPTLMMEVVNLHLLADPTANREEAHAKYMKMVDQEDHD